MYNNKYKKYLSKINIINKINLNYFQHGGTIENYENIVYSFAKQIRNDNPERENILAQLMSKNKKIIVSNYLTNQYKNIICPAAECRENMLLSRSQGLKHCTDCHKNYNSEEEKHLIKSGTHTIVLQDDKLCKKCNMTYKQQTEIHCCTCKLNFNPTIQKHICDKKQNNVWKFEDYERCKKCGTLDFFNIGKSGEKYNEADLNTHPTDHCCECVLKQNSNNFKWNIIKQYHCNNCHINFDLGMEHSCASNCSGKSWNPTKQYNCNKCCNVYNMNTYGRSYHCCSCNVETYKNTHCVSCHKEIKELDKVHCCRCGEHDRNKIHCETCCTLTDSEQQHCCFCKKIFNKGEEKSCECDKILGFITKNAMIFLENYPQKMMAKYPGQEVYPQNFHEKFVMSKCLNKDDSTFVKFVEGLKYFDITDLKQFFADTRNYEFLFHGTQTSSAVKGIFEDNFSIQKRGSSVGQAYGTGEYLTSDFYKTALPYAGVNINSNSNRMPSPDVYTEANVILAIVLSPTSPMLALSPKKNEYVSLNSQNMVMCDQTKIFRSCEPTRYYDRERYIVVQNFYDRFFVLPIYVYPISEKKTQYDNVKCVKANHQKSNLIVLPQMPVQRTKTGTLYSRALPLTSVNLINALEKQKNEILSNTSFRSSGLEYSYHNDWYDFHPNHISDIIAELKKNPSAFKANINIVVYPQGNNLLLPVNQSYTIDFISMTQTNDTTGAKTNLRLFL